MLGTTRRFGSRILRPAQRVAARLPLPAGVPRRRAERFLQPVGRRADPATGGSRCSPTTPTAPRPSTSPTCSAAPTSRTASRGPTWRCWSGPGAPRSPALRRALLAAGVPVEVAADDTPLVARARGRPAARRARDRGRCRRRRPVRPGVRRPRRGPPTCSPRRWPASTPPTCASWPGRCAPASASRRRPRARRPRPSPDLLRDARRSTRRPRRRARRRATPSAVALALARLVRTVRDELADGATVEQVLWVLWDGTAWPSPAAGCDPPGRWSPPGWPTATSTPSARSSTRPHARRTSRSTPRPRRSSHTLRAQQIPADTLAEQGVRGDAVRLLTAHRAKGLEWPLVVVAHVQEDAWPDLRRRATLLRADRIGVGGRLVPPDHDPRAARRRATAVLRRVHPRPPAARRDRGGVDRRRGRAAVALPVRARSRRRGPSRSPTSRAGPAGRCRWPGWSPSSGVPPPTTASARAAPRRRCRPPGPAGRASTAPEPAPGARPPTRRPGGGPARGPSATSRSARSTSRSWSRRAR